MRNSVGLVWLLLSFCLTGCVAVPGSPSPEPAVSTVPSPSATVPAKATSTPGLPAYPPPMYTPWFTPIPQGTEPPTPTLWFTPVPQSTVPPPTSTPTPSTTPTAIAFTNPITFADARLGLSFQYPAALGEVTVAIGAGDTGQAFGGRFSQCPIVYFAGISPDFSAGRGGMLSDTQGYYYDANTGRYFKKFVNTKLQGITPAGLLTVGDNVIVLLDQNSMEEYQQRLGPDQFAALINLKGATFPGMVFMNYDVHRVPVDTFVAILRTFVITEPRDP
jgi:hypothetical protein